MRDPFEVKLKDINIFGKLSNFCELTLRALGKFLRIQILQQFAIRTLSVADMLQKLSLVTYHPAHVTVTRKRI